MTQVIIALDKPGWVQAHEIVQSLAEQVQWYKVGLELYLSEGPAVIRYLKEAGKRVFLDLKFHDIPNTVKNSVAAAMRLGVDMTTLHIAGGEEMLRQSHQMRLGNTGSIKLVGVTRLTSDKQGQHISDHVVKMASQAVEWGMDGIVCSGLELKAVRKQLGPRVTTVIPGIRLNPQNNHDQKRVVTPAQAFQDGADFIVVGRAVTQSSDPIGALQQIMGQLR